MTDATVDMDELKYRLGKIRESGLDPRDAVKGAHADGYISTSQRRELLAWLSETAA